MIKITPELLHVAYELLRMTPPFNRMALPHGDEVGFRVMKTRNLAGTYEEVNGEHVITISAGYHGHLENVVMTMAHEMVHLYLRIKRQDGGGVHGAAFKRIAASVCRYHGYDPKVF